MECWGKVAMKKQFVIIKMLSVTNTYSCCGRSEGTHPIPDLPQNCCKISSALSFEGVQCGS